MDIYNPETVFSSIDKNGRYAYINQPIIAEWNLLRLAETLLPLIHEKQEKAIEMATETMNTFIVVYKKHWLEMMRKKLGLFRKENEDETLITDLLSWMQKNKADYINTFCSLPKKDIKKDKLFQDSVFQNWYQRWQKRLTLNKKSIELSFELMRHTNPVIIPRNHKVEEALNAAGVNGDFKLFYDLIEVLKKPYEDRPEIKIYQDPPAPSNYVYQTFCGT